MLNINEVDTVYLAYGFTDLRKSIDELSVKARIVERKGARYFFKRVLDTKGSGVLSKYLSVFYVLLGCGLRRFFVGGVYYFAKSERLRKSIRSGL